MSNSQTPQAYSDIPSVAPWDEHNQKWAGYVHPTDWENPRPSGRYNLVVIGAGPAGLVTAIGAAGLGAKVALVEKHLMGGDCLNVGCVPSKALIAAGKAAAAVRDAGQFGVNVPPGVEVDFAKVMERLRRIRADISHHDSAERFSKLGIDVYIGEGQFTGRSTFEIDGRKLEFSKACIATGARAAAPPIDGLDDVDYLNNETIFTLTDLPSRTAFIGAGPIGCELSQAFQRFGSDAMIITNSNGVLPREDRDAAEIVKASLLRDGVTIHDQTSDLALAADGECTKVAFTSAGEPQNIIVDKVVVAVGRAPNVENLGLDQAGVEYTSRGIVVDDRLRSSNKNIFAAGDVASRYQFTHSADFQARMVIANALFFGRRRASGLTIPWCTYTEPELAQVGKLPEQLEQEGTAFSTFVVHMNEIDRAILDGEDEGFVKVHANKKGKILGATVVAAHAGDMIGEISVAMTNGISLGSIANSIHPYPTQSEAIRKVGDQFNRTRLTPFVKGIMDRILRWRR